MENLRVGTCDWNRDEWQGSYYPEDMPEEWRLDFYANHYQAVLVPEKSWMQWTDEGVEEAVDSVEEDFRFYFQFGSTPDQSRLKQLKKLLDIATLAELTGGAVVVSDEESEVILKQFNPESLNLALTLVSTKHALPGWQWSVEGRMISGNPCGLIQQLSSDAKQQTELLKQFMGSLPKGAEGAPLFLCSDVIDMNQLSNLKVIGELLGY